jgi:hypothetical protein
MLVLRKAETERMKIQTRDAKTYSFEGISERPSDYVLDDVISFCICFRIETSLRDRESEMPNEMTERSDFSPNPKYGGRHCLCKALLQARDSLH